MRIFIIIASLLISNAALWAQSRWITHLDDNIPVSTLSIPGSHDSGTGEGIKGIIKIGITQEKSIAEQWQCGIRVFDLRPAIYEGELHICHGPLKTKISFYAAIDSIVREIDNNPDEFAIVLLRQESGNRDKEICKEWSKNIGKAIDRLGNRAAIFHPTITVGEMRGKILFLSRDHYQGSSKGAYIKGWNHSPKGTKHAEIIPYHKYDDKNNSIATLCIQDFYSPTQVGQQKAKFATIKEFIDNASAAPSGRWSINHLSGYSKFFLGIKGVASNKGYRENAAYNNRAIYEYITQANQRPKSCGIIMIDYVGSEHTKGYSTYGQSIVQAIIELNFR